MMGRLSRPRAVLAALAFATLLGPSLATPVQGSTAALSVTAYCYSNPERVVIHNNRTYAITIRSVGSLYQPRSNEPFYVYYRLYAGRTVTFYSGYAASSTSSRTLTRQYIFNNTVGSIEGVKVVATTGYYRIDRCG